MDVVVMGCDDYFNPVAEREHHNWRINEARLRELDFARGSVGGFGYRCNGDYAVCGVCAATVWIGEMHERVTMPEVEKHAQWHRGEA
jgi:hypothetical protein